LYGPQVAISDDYDEKAWIYVTVVTYESNDLVFDEVLTLRFVPAAGLPLQSDDLNFYLYKGAPKRPLLEVLVGELAGPGFKSSQALRGCYSQGRMGAIRPRARQGGTLPGNRHVGLAWCLMLECFLEETDRVRRTCHLLTSQTTEQLRVLGASIPTRPCAEHFGLESGSIVLNRSAQHVRDLCYGVPTYFLNLKDVSGLLSRLIKEGRLSTAAVQAATTEGIPLERALRHPQPGVLKRLHLLFSADGSIGGSRLQGDELRELADKEVRDGPVLRLTQLDQLELELHNLRQSATSRSAPQSFIRRTIAKDESA
jgi:hypothetical protein